MRLLSTPLCLFVISCTIYANPQLDLANHKSEPRINLMVEHSPLAKVLHMIVSYSGKKLILDTNLRETTTLSLSGISWREALKTLQTAHDLDVNETEKLIIISGLPNQIQDKDPIQVNAQPVSKTEERTKSPIRIAGITGNEQERVAIVEVGGKNQLWKLGSLAPEGFKVTKIDENSITLMHPIKNEMRQISF